MSNLFFEYVMELDFDNNFNFYSKRNIFKVKVLLATEDIMKIELFQEYENIYIPASLGKCFVLHNGRVLNSEPGILTEGEIPLNTVTMVAADFDVIRMDDYIDKLKASKNGT
jgi:hypothetical protein